MAHWRMVGWLILVLVLARPGMLDGKDTEEYGLTCGEDGFMYTIPKSQIGDSFPKLMIMVKGSLHELTEDVSCGSNLTEHSDGSLTITVSYYGCYVSQMDDSFVMALTISYKDDYGAWKIPEEKELKCPIRPAMDAPSPSQCATIDKRERLLCGNASVSSNQCQSLGCCYDPSDRVNTCYYGNKVTAQCTNDGIFSVAISKYVTLPNVDLGAVKLTRAIDTNCGPTTTTDSFLLFQFPLSACGTTSKLVGSILFYENELMAKRAVQTWQGSSITRDSTFRLTIRCSLSSEMQIPLHIPVNVFTLAPPPGVTSQGPLSLELRIAKDVRYTQYYTDGEYPILKVLRDPVFVEVRLLQRVDPQLVLFLQQCWATPTVNPINPIQWPLLLNGCPFPGDNYATLISSIDQSASGIQFPSYYKRFIVDTFTFTDATSQPLQGNVYFHCSASVCAQSATQSCSTVCPTGFVSGRSKKHVYQPNMNMVSSHGPIDFRVSPENLKMRESRASAVMTSVLWVGIVSALAVVCVAVAAMGIWRFSVKRKPNVTLVNM
ncbi:Hypothetical predicted protein [Pelobates cultripes]|uniref:Zona pellucida sperm-binding protein 4 n=1 Tax=Pelobates cultripes TaxID=61616 RepID=A0AAD1R7K7_PELCU|nr:Hypothetical predicted protein [Pelobates cultripes]